MISFLVEHLYWGTIEILLTNALRSTVCIINFHATLKGQAGLGQFKVKCHNCHTDVDYSEEDTWIS